MQGFNAEHLQEKWAPILNHEGLGGINDAHKRMVTAVLLENQEKMLNEEREFLSEAPTNSTGSGVANFDPVLISLIRRAMPNLVAYDLAGVQPMNGPTGLIFAMRSRFTSQTGAEALFDEADTGFSNSGLGFDGTISYVAGSGEMLLVSVPPDLRVVLILDYLILPPKPKPDITVGQGMVYRTLRRPRCWSVIQRDGILD